MNKAETYIREHRGIIPVPVGAVIVKPNTKLAKLILLASNSAVLEKRNKERKEQAQASIRAELPSLKERSLVLPDGTVLATDNEQDGKASVDMAKLLADYPLAYAACVSPGASFRVMRIKKEVMLLQGKR